MSAVPVTILPPGPQELHYDEHQFRRAYAKAVTKETGLSYADYLNSMHQIKKRGVFWLKRQDWALDDQKVRAVVLRYMESRYYLSPKPGATSAERLETIRKAELQYVERVRVRLDQMLDDRVVCDSEIQNTDSQIMNGAKGMAATVVKVIYLYYRLGRSSSVHIAQETGLKPPNVRILLYRLNKIAKLIEAGIPARQHLDLAKPVIHNKPRKPKPALIERHNAAMRLRAEGLTWDEIGKKLGVLVGTLYAWERNHRRSPETARAAVA